MLKKIMIACLLLTSPLQGIEFLNPPCDVPTPINHQTGERYPLGPPSEYEAYPGCAYENSFTNVQIATTVLVGIAVIAVIVVAFVNTPKRACSSHCH